MTDKPTLTSEAIEAAADQLQAEEKRVSVATVRAHLGYGSRTTIGNALADWRERQEKIQAAPPIPEAVSAVISKAATELWVSATEAHRGELERLRFDHAGQLSNMQEDLEASEKYGTAMEARAAAFENDRDALQSELEQTRTALAAAEARAEALQAQLDKLQQAEDARLQAVLDRIERLEKQRDSEG